MTQIESGEIIGITKRKDLTDYLVRLSKTSTLVISSNIFQPHPTFILPKGTFVQVTFDQGKVSQATTDSICKVMGKIKVIRKTNKKITYILERDDEREYEIASDLIEFHPKGHCLSRNSYLELTFIDTLLVSAKPTNLNKSVKVSQIFLTNNLIQVEDKQGGRILIRATPELAKYLKKGDTVDLAIKYDANGRPKYSIECNFREKQQETPEVKTHSPFTIDLPKPSKGTNRVRHTEPTPDKFEAEVFGVDPILLESVKHGDHRPEIVTFLERHLNDELIEWYYPMPGRSPKYKIPDPLLDPKIIRAIKKSIPEFTNFYSHQGKAIDAIRGGKNVIIVTQTASGKTLSYNPAVFEFLLKNPDSHMLYVFPLKALMTDQLEKIDDMISALEKEGVKITSSQMVGGMGHQSYDSVAKSNPNIVVTNPEMLNYILDRSSTIWSDFLSNLKFIIIDEVHSYHGLIGIHMAGIIRRLLITAKRLRSNPRFILSSATVNNPLDLASRITSLPKSDFCLLGKEKDDDGSQQAVKHWLVLNPDWGTNEQKYFNYQEVAADVFVEMLLSKDESGKSHPLNTILFCRSMREVNNLKKLVDQRLAQKAPSLKSKVKAYISASLSNREKQEIYQGLKNGNLLGVISTNALEAGIDIGNLDACIIAGFQFSVMSMRQMAGRVGRKKEGLALFIPYPNSSMDQYYRDHPQLLIDQQPEEFVIDPQNPYISRKYINAVAYPNGITENELVRFWGDKSLNTVNQAKLDGVMRRDGDRWLGTRRNYSSQGDKYAIVNIRSNIQQPFVICDSDQETCKQLPECLKSNESMCKNRIGLLDQQYVYRDCHPDAIYEKPDKGIFHVIKLDPRRRIVKVTHADDDCLERTFVETDSNIELADKPRNQKEVLPGVNLAWGEATVTRSYSGYFTYTLKPSRYCRRCKKIYDISSLTCPICKHSTNITYSQSKSTREDFPSPYEQGYKSSLNTISSWLSIDPDLEAKLMGCSHCKLPGDQNKVLVWITSPLETSLPKRVNISEEEKKWIASYHKQANEQISKSSWQKNELLLYPGIYDQCLLAFLRTKMNESRALELFQAFVGYPVTDDLNYICRNCRSSVLLQAMHTLEHVVIARYPSVALGDRSDIGSYTTLGHSATKKPTIFWFDCYEGGIGAAEKVFDIFPRILAEGLNTIKDCSCATIEGCPRCTYIPDCSEGNNELNKPAAIQLLSYLLGLETEPSSPFIYQAKKKYEFDKTYKDNQWAEHDQGIGEEMPLPIPLTDPYQLLHIQKNVHKVVVDKAFEVRSREIVDETPPINALQLNQAYLSVLSNELLSKWQFRQNGDPYETLEITPNASLKMIRQIYRIIAFQIHPDSNPDNISWASEMMTLLNSAYEKITTDKAN